MVPVLSSAEFLGQRFATLLIWALLMLNQAPLSMSYLLLILTFKFLLNYKVKNIMDKYITIIQI